MKTNVVFVLAVLCMTVAVVAKDAPKPGGGKAIRMGTTTDTPTAVPSTPPTAPSSPGNSSGVIMGSTTDTITLASGRVVTYSGIAKVEAESITFVTPAGKVFVANSSLPTDIQNTIKLIKRLRTEVRGQVGKLNADGIFIRQLESKTEQAKRLVPDSKRMTGRTEIIWKFLASEIFILGGYHDVTAGVANGSDWKGIIYPAGSYRVKTPIPNYPEHETKYVCYAYTPEEAALWARNHPAE